MERWINKKQEQDDWRQVEKIVNEFNIRGSDRFYVVPGNLLQLKDQNFIKPSTLSPVVFLPKPGSKLIKTPEPGDTFMVVSHSFSQKEKGKLNIEMLWGDRIVLAIIDMKKYSVRDVFFIISSSSDCRKTKL